ncbi:MAG TPA: DUF4386 domain-containing protein [Cyclobacteriaceae bacterium]|nr:DUF4386 domain-containing protein [Cytophagales bacterium]HRE65763.1 DUF4386 domain-containing protein [Cyclobacteriaceae bacterium]HRF32407.1 DUF4386 domain-containing protein [Cyclobacteriaceae bacterium]
MNGYLDRKKTARLAGLLFFLWIISGFYDMFFVSPKIFVSGDPVASAQNILKYEFLFRTSIFSGLITSTLWVLLVWVFYDLFRTVNERYAKLLMAFVVVQIPVAFVKAGLSIAAILTLKGGILKSFELAQRQDLAMAFLKINDYTVLALELFWGLWLFPLAILIYQSVFIPRFLGIWLIINGIVYVLLSFTSIVLPEYKDLIFTFGMPAMFGELALMLWLLIKGVRGNKGVASS